MFETVKEDVALGAGYCGIRGRKLSGQLLYRELYANIPKFLNETYH